MGHRKSSPKKSEKVKSQRGFSPEEVVTGGELLKRVRNNPNHPGQHLEIYWFENYVWVIPVVTETDELKTAYKSRKWKRELGK